jgi:hypothetical protein
MPKPIMKSSRRFSELARFLGDAPLVADEKQQDYDDLYNSVVSTLTQLDVIIELYVKDFVDLSWQIRRERLILAAMISLFQKQVVQDLLETTDTAVTERGTASYRIIGAGRDAQRWLGDPVACKEIGADLEARGYSASKILAQAYINGAAEIEEVERRISSYEVRRLMALREIERRSEKIARQLESATADIIDGQFKEAAE